MTQPDHRPLDGIRVLDLTHVLAGPYATYQLGLLGAEVIKVEPLHGDLVRAWGGTREQMRAGMGTGYVSQNAGKRSIAVNLASPEGTDIVRSLAAEVDILIENYRPGVIEGYGLSADELMQQNPSLIYVSVSAFGHTGPEAGRPGFDDVVQATSGYMAMNVRGDGPIRTGGPVLDYATGMHTTSAVLAALMLRTQTGEGQHIDLAMQDVAMLLVNRNTSITASTGEATPPAGNRDAPLLGRYAAAEGWVMLAGYLPRHKRQLLDTLGLDEYASLPTAELEQRMPEIEVVVEQTLATKTAAEWDVIFADRSVVGAGVRDLAAVIESGQPAGRQLLSEVETATGSSQVTNAGYLINGNALAPRSGVHSIGQDTRDICSQLGLDAARIDQMIADGVLGEPAS